MEPCLHRLEPKENTHFDQLECYKRAKYSSKILILITKTVFTSKTCLKMKIMGQMLILND